MRKLTIKELILEKKRLKKELDIIEREVIIYKTDQAITPRFPKRG